MYVDTSHITRGGKTYTRHLLRESYRAHGKVLHRTIANVSHCSEAEIEAIQQNPRSSRRNLLPMKCINGSLLMGHEHLTCAVVELMQSRKTASGADRVLHDAPEAFNGIEVMATMGR